MNTKKAVRKLSLNKKTVALLNDSSMDEAKGGLLPKPTLSTNCATNEYTICFCSWVYSCDFATCSPSWCGLQCR